MASSAMLKLVCVGLLGLLILAPHAQAAVGCNVVYDSLSPCLGFLGGLPLNPKCCPSIKGQYGRVTTKLARQSVCGCHKSLAKSYSSHLGRAQQLLQICRVSLPYALDPGIDCSK